MGAHIDNFVPELIDENAALKRRVTILETAIREYNEGCQAQCGVGDMEAVGCGYRPYFEYNRRRCPTCPTHDTIDLPADAGAKG